MSIRSRYSFGTVAIGLVVAAGMAGGSVWLTTAPVAAQAPRAAPSVAPRPARTPDGKPNLNGIWQALNSANWDLLDHAAKPSPVVAMGALGAIPAGQGVVVGGEIPYKPEALAKQKENEAHWLERDPTVKCYMPGVPRATYMPFPFQIVQTPEHLLIAYEFASASRTVYLKSKEESPLDAWMGWSLGHWEGNTLVVQVNAFNDQTWFDATGTFHSDQLKVTERYSLVDATHMNYEATIEDPATFTRPWTIKMPLYRRIEPQAQLLEFKCIEFVEELMYGHLRKKTE
jgi:hypothetical protein